MSRPIFLVPVLMFVQFLFVTPPSHSIVAEAAGGNWTLLQKSIGIVAMHMQLLNNDRVIIFDRTDFGKSNLSLPDGKCRNDSSDLALKSDCTAHSVEYNSYYNTFRALTVLSDVWCSSGSVSSTGRLIQTGGFNDGARRVRVMAPCVNGCDWVEINNGIGVKRWYATNHQLPDGRQIIIGGIGEYNYEFYPKTPEAGVYKLQFLNQTYDAGIENNLYPFCFLYKNGNMFIFANNQSILFDFLTDTVVRTYPTIPGGDPRNYPSTGSAVLLPLKNLTTPDNIVYEVLICGGAPRNSYALASKGVFIGALDTCGRMRISDDNPQWVMETMPLARVMGDMLLLPNGNVIIINGAGNGTAAYGFGRNPVLNPIIYYPEKATGSRFEVQNPTTIPRMYHSTAILLRNGRLLVGGSNPQGSYTFSKVLFPTELRLEAFSPSYLDSEFDNVRPQSVSLPAGKKIRYNQWNTVQFQVTGTLVPDTLVCTLVSPSFTTHSFSQNQRLLVLDHQNLTAINSTTYQMIFLSPSSSYLAPSTYYMLFVVHQDIPGTGVFIKLF